MHDAVVGFLQQRKGASAVVDRLAESRARGKAA